MSEKWIVISALCHDCGGDVQAKLFDREPTDAEANNFEFGGTCARSWTLKLDDNGEVHGAPEY